MAALHATEEWLPMKDFLDLGQHHTMLCGQLIDNIWYPDDSLDTQSITPCLSVILSRIST
jgi:hypothetical protein